MSNVSPGRFLDPMGSYEKSGEKFLDSQVFNPSLVFQNSPNTLGGGVWDRCLGVQTPTHKVFGRLGLSIGSMGLAYFH